MQNSIWEKMKKMMEEHPVSHVRRLKKPIAMVCIVALAAANLQVNSAVTVTNAAETAVEESTGSDARETENAEEHTKPAEPAAEKKEEAPADSGQPAEVKEAEPEEKPAAQEEEPAASSASDEKEAEEAAGREPAEAEPAEEAAPEDASEEAAPAEETADEAEAASSAVTEAAPEEAKPAAGELTAKGRGYTVTVTFTEKAGLPEGTKLQVKEITGSAGSRYEDRSADVMNVDSAKITEARFFDINLVDKDGKPLEPNADVKVRIILDQAPAEASDVQVIHFDDNSAAGDETVTAKVNDATDIKFTADSFSVYGVVYTVDFTYGGFTYKMDGDGSILLSTLAKELGLYEKDYNKAFKISNVSEVTFTDYDLIKVEKQADGDWLLTSLGSFTSEETLTITMEDGVVFVIEVTDPPGEQSSSSLVDFMTGVNIQAPTNDQGAYVVQPGTEYTINMSFQERPDRQFDNTSMTYSIPDGLEADGHSGTFSVSIERGGNTYTIAGNSYSIENGVLTVTWNQSDPNYSQLTASANVKFSLSFDGSFDEDAAQIRFSDSIVKDVVVDTTNSVSTTKAGNVDMYNNKIYYTTTVTSTGTSRNVVLTDRITGTGVTLDPNSIQATSSTGQPVSMTGGASGNTFTYTIPQMKNGETITFQYAADIDPSVLQMIDGKVVTQSGNTFKATSEGDPEGDRTHTENTINYTPKVNKSSGEVISTDGTVQTLQWNLTVNPDAKVSAAGTRVTDTIGSGSQSIMKYSGSGITVEVTDVNGTVVRTDNVAWSSMDSKTDSQWVYTIPQSDRGHAYKYRITYTTDVETKDLKKLTDVDNTVTTNGDESSTGKGQVGPVGGGVEIHKEATNVDKANREITWTVTFVVPGTGLDKAVVTDTYPNQWVVDEQIYEMVKEGTITVTGLTDGEDWNPVYGRESVVITFTKDGAPGLKGTGTARTITVILKTEISDKWIEASRTSDHLKDHTNNVELNYGDVITDSAVAKITANEVKKSSTGTSSRTENGVELPVYKYELVLNGVESDSFTINDAFDTEILMPYTDGEDAFIIYGGDQYYQGARGDSPVSYINTADGMTMSVGIDSLPKNGSDYYTTYRLIYYLTVKDQAALNKLAGRAAAAEDATTTLNNTADWEGTTDTTSVAYTYDGLDKEILTSDEDLKKTDKDIYADFRITLNPSGAVLNGGQPVTMTDTVSNLSVDLTSITATPADGVTWDMSGNTVTYTIPDATKIVITYRARVIFTTIGETGETVSVNFSNEAEMLGYHDDISRTAERHNSGQGSGTVPRINLLKYEAGNMTKRLSGAVFALLDADGNPVTDKNGNEVTFTTGPDGMLTVEGDEERDGWTIIEDRKYILRETQAPPGYKLANFDYEFTVSSDGTTDYSHYIYHSGDTMSAKNYPGTDINVKKIWEDGNDKHDADTVTFKLYQTINGEKSATIRMMVGEDWVDVSDYAVLVLNKDNDWQGSFSGLPATVPPTLPDDGETDYVRVSYDVEEILVNDEAPDEDYVDYQMTPPPYSPDAGDVPGGTYIWTFTNKIKTGDLKITKTFAGNTDKLTDEDKNAITFTVSGPEWEEDQTFTYADDMQPDGVKIFEDIKVGDYTVTENTGSGKTFTTTYQVGSDGTVETGTSVEVTLDENGKEIAFTNTYQETEVTLDAQKAIETEDGVEAPEKSFKFILQPGEVKVAGEDEVPMPEEGTEAIVKGTGKVSESETPFGTITYTKAGTYTYIITEEDESGDGWYYNVDGDITATVTVEEDGETGALSATVDYSNNDTITNKYVTGGIKVIKTAQLNGQTDPEAEGQTFTVAVFSDEAGTEQVGESKVITIGSDGKGEVVFDGLTVGTTYYVFEMDGAEKAGEKLGEYTVVEGSGSAAAAEVITEPVELVNNKEVGGLTITKTFAGNTDKLTEDDKNVISFTVTGPEWEEPQTFTYADMENGVRTFENIKLGDYTVTEDTGSGKTFTTTYKVGSDGTETEGTTVSVTVGTDGETVSFTNTYQETEITLDAQKAIETEDGVEAPEKSFKFILQPGEVKVPGEDEVPMPEEGTEAIVKGDGKVSESETPFGTITYTKAGTYTYIITEEDESGEGWTYNVNGDITATVTVTEAPDTGALSASVEYDKDDTITNEYVTGGIRVIKTAQLNGEPDPGAEGLTFTAALFSDQNGTQQVGESKVITIGADGTGEVIFDGLTVGTTYYVFEMDGEEKAGEMIGGYKVIQGSGSTAAAVEIAEAIELVNNKEVGDLKVSKSLAGNAAEADREFHFNITVEGASGSYEAEGAADTVSFTDGAATVTLKGGESVLIKGLPADAPYAVTEEEADQNDYVTSSDGASGLIEAGKVADAAPEAAFTNTKNKGGLTITKTFAGNTDKLTEDDKNAISFTVTGPEWEEPQTFTYADMENGVRTFEDIKLGDYTVTENNGSDKIFVTTYKVASEGTGQTGITAVATVGTEGETVSFTNTYQETEITLDASKAIDAEDGTTVPEKSFKFILKEGEVIKAGEGAVPMPEEGTEAIVQGAGKVSESETPFGTITYVKAGVYTYIITEEDESGAGWTYNVNGDITATVTVTEDPDTGALNAAVEYDKEGTITNSYETGDLQINKEVVSDRAADKDQKFTFTIKLDDKTITGIYGDMTFEEGVATIELVGGESKTATGLPADTGYTVTEATAKGFVTESKGDSGTITAGETAIADFTNTRETGDLEISKEVVSDKAADKDQIFSFTIELSDTTISGTYGGITFAEGVATIELKGGESKIAEGLPTEVDYIVTEAEATGFFTEKDGDTGTITTKKSTADFTNTRETGGLKVSKSVESSTESDKTREFLFMVTLDDETINGTYGEMEFINGIAEFILKDGESKAAEGLPATVGYTVEEEDANTDNFVTTSTGTAGTIEKDASPEAAFENTKVEGGLAVTKSVTSSLEADHSLKFHFTVTLDDKTVNGTYGQMEFINGIAEFELADGESCAAEGLAKDIGYKVEEDEDGKFTTSCTGQTGKILEKDVSTAAFTNTRKTGDLEISKEVVSDRAADMSQTFTFTIELDDKTISGTYGDIIFEDGTATVELKGGETKTAAGLPTEVNYTVTESPAKGFLTEMTGDTGTILEDETVTADFTNTRETGDLTVSKTVESENAIDTAKEFTFTVTLSDTTINGTYGDMAFTDGVAEFTLKADESKTAEGLPTEITYTVTEEEVSAGYTNTGKTGDTGAISTAPQTAEFVNTYEASGSVVLEAYKELESGFGKELREDQFSFELYQGGELLQVRKNDAGGKITFDPIEYTVEGTYTYTIKETIETKPGYTYDMAEKRVTVTVVNNGDGTLTATPVYDGGSALFINSYETSGSAVLKAYKTLENRKLEDKQFIFELVNDETGVVMHTVWNDAGGNITFPAISYTKPGTYTYTIREVVKGEKGYIYDTSEKKAAVTVTDLDEGILVTEVTYDGSDKIPEFVNRYEASVSVRKTDIMSGKELAGATLQVLDADGMVIDEWTSTTKDHEVTGLKTGETYTLHEKAAPEGYLIAADTTFTLNEDGSLNKGRTTATIDGKGVLLVEDTHSGTRILKVDEKGRPLGGAKLRIEDGKGCAVAKWTSYSTGPVEVKDLKPGVHYFLTETSAPSGYKKAAAIEFYVNKDGKIVIVSGGGKVVDNVLIMKDSKVTAKGKKKPHRSTRTGDDANAALWAVLAAAAAAGAAGTVIARKRKKGKKG